MTIRTIRAVVIAAMAAQAAAAEVSNAGLAAHWSFDERAGATVQDRSGNGNTGVVTGARWVEGASGGALQFDGKSYVECAATPSLHITDSITVAMWVYLTEYPDPKVSYGWRDLLNKAGAYQVSLVAGMGLTFSALNDGKISRDTPPEKDFTLNRWHHVAVTYRMAHNEQRVYIDGVRKDVPQPRRVFAIDTTAAVLRIGNQDGGARYGNSNHFVGRLDELRLYHRVLSAEEVAELYRTESPAAK